MTRRVPTLLVAVATLVSGDVTAQTIRMRVGIQSSSTLLSVSNFTCTGAFLTPGVNVAGRTTSYPIAMRYESGTRHYFIYDGTGTVYEFPEPSLSSCSTAIGSVTRASLEGWGGSWGTLNVNAGGDTIPGMNTAFAQGLTWDDTTAQLILSWAGSYAQVGIHNSFAGVTLNANHTMTLNGCWGLSGITQPSTGSGVLMIPAAFVTANLPAGARWGIGLGYYNATIQSGPSMGPAVYATVPPSPNACEASTDHLVSSTTMEYHLPNAVGPNCFNAGPGCTPSQAPTTPYPSQIAYTTYSEDIYPESWVPYAGHGWAGFGTTGHLGWYDDGTKQGIVDIVITKEGWASTTIVSSSSATAAVLASTSTHDTFQMNPGDHLWLQTCTPGVDPGCTTPNLDHFSEVTLSTVNTGTGAITYTVDSGDFGSGNHFGVPGGPAYFGCVYAHGSPTCSRATLRMQIFDPAQYAQVIANTLAQYSVVASDDAEIDTGLITNLGSASAGAGIAQAAGGATGSQIVAVIPDATAHDVLVAVSSIGNFGSVASDIIYVLHVNHAVPAPTPVVSVFGAWLRALTGLH